MGTFLGAPVLRTIAFGVLHSGPPMWKPLYTYVQGIACQGLLLGSWVPGLGVCPKPCCFEKSYVYKVTDIGPKPARP